MSKITVLKADAPTALKILAYGPPKSGKTQFALSFPRPILIDSEGGSRLFVGRPGLDELPMVSTADINTVREVVDEVRADKGVTYDTLIIDSISVIYDAMVYEAMRGNRNRRVDPAQWNYINSTLRHLLSVQLVGLSVNVIVIARQAAIWETRQGDSGSAQLVRTNEVKPNADPMIMHFADAIIRIEKNHSAVVEAMRGVKMEPNKNRLGEIDYARLLRFMQTYGQKEPVAPPNGRES